MTISLPTTMSWIGLLNLKQGHLRTEDKEHSGRLTKVTNPKKHGWDLLNNLRRSKNTQSKAVRDTDIFRSNHVDYIIHEI